MKSYNFGRLGIDFIKSDPDDGLPDDGTAFGIVWSPWHTPVVEIHFWRWSIYFIWTK